MIVPSGNLWRISVSIWESISRFKKVVDWTYAWVMSLLKSLMLRRTSEGASARISRWLACWIVGDWVKMTPFPASLYAWIISLDFSYGVSVDFPFTLFTSLELKIRPLWILRSYRTNLNTPLVIRLLISRYCDSWNGCPGVVITSFRLRSLASSRSLSSFLIINAIEIYCSSYIEVRKCLAWASNCRTDRWGINTTGLVVRIRRSMSVSDWSSYWGSFYCSISTSGNSSI